MGEYRVEVDQRGELPEISLLIESFGGDAVAGELAARLRSVFSMRIPVRAVESGTLPVFEVKAKRWKVICE